MPTGYTEEIINGNIKTFPEFAKICMRAFGATIHMKEDGLNAEYKKMQPSDYHTKKIIEAELVIYEAKTFTDKKIVRIRKKKLQKDIEDYKNKIAETEKTVSTLNNILSNIRKWKVPSSDYIEFKNFMIEQITETIRFEGDTKYYADYILQYEDELLNLSADNIRKGIIEEAERSIIYHKAENLAEIKRCDESNKWVENLLKSLQ